VIGEGESITIMCAGGVFEGGRSWLADGADGSPKWLHLVNGHDVKELTLPFAVDRMATAKNVEHHPDERNHSKK
jgi:hypothetical protein